MAFTDDGRNRADRQPQQFLPDIGLDVPQWLQNFLAVTKSRLESLYIDPDPPGQVTGFTITAANSGVLLNWNPAPKAARYSVYRNTSADLSTATFIASRQGNDNISYFDVGDQLNEATLYYWVVPENAAGVHGPTSRMLSTANISIVGNTTPDLPFTGVLGDGRHGALDISANTTLTDPVFLYQLTSLNVESGKTLTGKAQNPGGIFIAVKGTATIAGTIDVNGLGASGGPTVTGSPSNGTDAYPGLNLGGSGGGGGGSTGGATGGYGAPVRLDTTLGGWAPGGVVRGGSDTSWFGTNTGATNSQLRRETGTAVLAEGAGGAAASNGTAGNSISSIWTNIDDLFSFLWLSKRQLIYGYGGGGGGGGSNGGASGVGGAGGGMVIILCDTLNFTGTINANGANGTAGSGTSGGAGGGGGGVVLIGYRTLVANSGTINVAGGSGGVGGTTGGAGGSGYKRVFDMRM